MKLKDIRMMFRRCTDAYVKKIDDAIDAKSQEIMTV